MFVCVNCGNQTNLAQTRLQIGAQTGGKIIKYFMIGEKIDRQEFQIIFDKLEEVRKENVELFSIKGAELTESIREIQNIVDSYNAPNSFTTFTRA